MINQVVLVGRMVKDAELKFTAGKGTAVANITLAVDKFINGEKDADYIQIVIWGKQAENTANYTFKGSLVGITGRIQTRSYETKEGQKRYVTEVVANEVKFLGSKRSNENQNEPKFNDFEEVADDWDNPF